MPTAHVLNENIGTLAVADRATVLVTSAFLWAKRDLPAFAADAAMRQLAVAGFLQSALRLFRRPSRTTCSTSSTDSKPAQRPAARWSSNRTSNLTRAKLMDDNNWTWDVRVYPPAVVAIGRRTNAQAKT